MFDHARGLLVGDNRAARRFKSPLREFLSTESGGAAVLLAATAAALVWMNVDASSYEELWKSVLAIDLGGGGRADAARVAEQRADDVLLLWVWRRGVSSTSATLASGGGSCSRCWRRSAGGAPRRRSASRSTSEARPPRAGALRCRPTRRSRWDCSRCSAGGLRTACVRHAPVLHQRAPSPRRVRH